MRDTTQLSDGRYRARCSEPTALCSGLNGHSTVWPEASVRVARAVAHFTKNGVEVWSYISA